MNKYHSYITKTTCTTIHIDFEKNPKHLKNKNLIKLKLEFVKLTLHYTNN